MMGTMTLTDFLLARLAEDEEVARAASRLWQEDPATGDWDWAPGEPAAWITGDDYGSGAVERTNGDPREPGIVVYDEGSPSGAEARHIARHDPAHVLADVEAKRRIALSGGDLLMACDAMPKDADEVRREAVRCAANVYEFAIRALAMPYSGHPDFREEWRP